jgi:hypothetical protein
MEKKGRWKMKERGDGGEWKEKWKEGIQDEMEERRWVDAGRGREKRGKCGKEEGGD